MRVEGALHQLQDCESGREGEREREKERERERERERK